MSKKTIRAETADMPMKWHNFLIYFSLWATPITFLVMGLTTMTGYIYGDAAAQMYADYKGLRVGDILLGLCSIGIGVYALFVRSALANFKKGAPKKLNVLYILNTAFALLQALLTLVILGGSMGDQALTSAIGCVIAIGINSVYCGKRAHLFIN